QHAPQDGDAADADACLVTAAHAAREAAGEDETESRLDRCHCQGPRVRVEKVCSIAALTRPSTRSASAMAIKPSPRGPQPSRLKFLASLKTISLGPSHLDRSSTYRRCSSGMLRRRATGLPLSITTRRFVS